MPEAHIARPGGSAGGWLAGDRPDGWLLPAALCLSVLALLARLLLEPFDHGYTRYAAIGAEMIRSGDWVVQRHAGHLYFDKPPLQSWLIALPMLLGGTTSRAAQLVPSLLAWLTSLGFTYAFGRRWFGGHGRAALAAALVLGSSLGFAFLLRDKRLDPLFAGLLTGSLYFAWAHLEDAPRRRFRNALGAWILLALATLEKGPLAPLVLLLVVVPYAAWTGRLRRLLGREQLVGLALFLLGVSVWPLLVVERLGLEPALAAIRATRMTTRMGGPLLYAKELPLRFLPWTLLLPAAGVWLAAAKPQRDSRPMRFAFCWLLAVLVPLHFAAGKHYRYLLPAFPALALAVTALWHLPAPAALPPGRWQVRLQALGVGALLGGLAVASVFVPIAVGLRSAWRALPGSPVALGLLVVAWLAVRALRGLPSGSLRAFEAAVVAATLVFAIYDGARALEFQRRSAVSAAACAVLAPIARGEPSRGLGLDKDESDALQLATAGFVEPSPSPAALIDWLATLPGRGLVVTDEKRAQELGALGGFELTRRAPFTLAHSDLVLLELATTRRSPASEAPAGRR